jgi:hypothetical protein
MIETEEPCDGVQVYSGRGPVCCGTLYMGDGSPDRVVIRTRPSEYMTDVTRIDLADLLVWVCNRAVTDPSLIRVLEEVRHRLLPHPPKG